jgi:hypothetical protein
LADKPNEQAAKYYPLVHIHYGKLWHPKIPSLKPLSNLNLS